MVVDIENNGFILETKLFNTVLNSDFVGVSPVLNWDNIGN